MPGALPLREFCGRVSFHESVQIVILETSGADSSALTEAAPEISAAIAVRPLGTAGRCVGVIIGMCSL